MVKLLRKIIIKLWKPQLNAAMQVSYGRIKFKRSNAIFTQGSISF
nr:MAG TPA: hypothetical protein [Caudoviricetes sp.]